MYESARDPHLNKQCPRNKKMTSLSPSICVCDAVTCLAVASSLVSADMVTPCD